MLFAQYHGNLPLAKTTWRSSEVRWGSVQVSAQHSHPAGRELRRALRSQSFICRPFIHHTIRSWSIIMTDINIVVLDISKSRLPERTVKGSASEMFCLTFLDHLHSLFFLFFCPLSFGAGVISFFIYFKSFIQANTFHHILRKKKPHSRT